MTIAQTSREAYEAFSDEDLQYREKQVLSAFSGNRELKLTRLDISVLIGRPINCVTGRVRTLLDKGWLASAGSTVNTETNKRHELVRLA